MTASVVTFVSPTPNTPPGTAGGFSAAFNVAKLTPIVLTITNAGGLGAIAYASITAVFLDGTAETVYRMGSFVGSYVKNSAQSLITNGYSLSILRDNGWPGASPGSNLAVGLIVDVADSNLNTVGATRRITATLDGVGGVTYGESTIAISSGITAGAMSDGGTYLSLPLTLGISVPAAQRLATITCTVPPSYAGLGDFVSASGIGIATSGTDATLRVPKSIFQLGPSAGAFPLDITLELSLLGTGGGINSFSGYYQLPSDLGIPVPLVTPDVAAADRVAEGLSLLVWQFRSA